VVAADFTSYRRLESEEVGKSGFDGAGGRRAHCSGRWKTEKGKRRKRERLRLGGIALQRVAALVGHTARRGGRGVRRHHS
jgi:hypothetical protein